MASFDYNPITGQLDLVGSGGGTSYINGVVADSSLLPTTLGTPALDSVFLAKAGSGVWLINRRPAGLYVRVANNGVAADWTYLGAFPEVNADGNWELYNSTDPTKELKFDLSGLPTATVRTVSAPAGNGQMLVEGQSIGATTRASGAFTTLNANSTITGQQGSNAGSSSAPALSLGAANTGIYIAGGQMVFAQGGVDRMYFDNSSRITIANSGGLDFFTDVPLRLSRGVILQSEIANGILAQRNSTQAMEYRLYATQTSTTNYQRMTVKSVRQTLSALSGASATTTGTFIPDGAVVVGITTRVATAITGATGYTIGDGTDADRWGDITGTAIGTTSDNRDWTAGTIECFTAGGNVTLTAKTSNFTAGAVEICVFYLAGEAD